MKYAGNILLVVGMWLFCVSGRTLNAQQGQPRPSQPFERARPPALSSQPDDPAQQEGSERNSRTDVKTSVRFTSLGIEDGLSSNRINDILRDSRGFLWIGTDNGLNRFDGYRVTHYSSDPADPNTLGGDLIEDIIEDRRGRLWIACATEGVSRFDPRTGAFVRYQQGREDVPGVKHSVFSLFEDQAGKIWAGTVDSRLMRIDPDSKEMTVYSLNPENSARTPRPVWEIIAGQDGVLWATASDALVKFHPETGKATRYAPSHNQGEIRSVYEASDGAIWITADDLYRFDPHTEQFRRDLNTNAPIARMIADQSGQFWLGTYDGLLCFDPQQRAVIHRYTHHPNEADSLSSKQVFSLHKDAEGILWVGTRDAGVNRMLPRPEQFHHYRIVSHQEDSVTTEAVTAMTGDASGAIWLDITQGLFRFQPDSEVLTAHGIPHHTCPFRTETIARDPSGGLWLNVCESLYHVDEEDGSLTQYAPFGQARPLGPPARLVGIEFGPDREMWLAYWRYGLVRFDRRANTFHSYRPDPKNPHSIHIGTVTAVYRDSTEKSGSPALEASAASTRRTSGFTIIPMPCARCMPSMKTVPERSG